MARNAPIRDQRRLELIQATIAVIARHGYSGTTVARVAERARVSTGLMNFHFDSKARLFEATFAHLNEEYERIWQKKLAAAAADPWARVTAMIETYFDRRIFTRDRLAVWFTFWSDAELRDRYRAAAIRAERRYIAALETEIHRLIAESSGPGREAKPITAALSAMVDGYWLQAMIYPKTFDRKAAAEACIAFLTLRLSALKPGPLPGRKRPASLASSHSTPPLHPSTGA
ncbi:MAG TPA: transcriptional regulator BetI [Dongiaceae bacterium]|nr:transcriptional regulator BetI [Dongiaceae bacterium]